MIQLLRAEPRFARWSLAEGASMVGSSVSQVTLPVIVYELTGSAALTGLLFASRLLPYLVLGLVAGPVADRSDRRRLIIGGNVAEGLLAATIPVAAAAGALTTGHVLAVTLLAATVFVFSDAAVFGAVPSLVRQERLAAANGFIAVIASGADIVGPLIAGVCIVAFGPIPTLWLTAVGFVSAAAVQATIPGRFRKAGGPPAERRTRAQLAVARQFLRGQRQILVLVLAGFGNSVGIGVVIGLLVPWAVENLGYGSDDGRLGLLYAASGLGGLVAGVVFPRLYRALPIPLLTPVSLGWSAVCCSALLVVPASLAPVALLAFSTGIMVTISAGITYRQEQTPDRLLSTVNALGRMVAVSGQPVGAGLGAAIALVSGVTAAFAAAAAAIATTAVLSRRFLRVAPQPGEPRPEEPQPAPDPSGG